MKKIFYFLITILFFTSVKVYAADATITDLSCTKKTGGVENSLNATVDGLNITVDDVVFEDAGDFMKCTFKINNTSDDDLEVDFESISNKSDDKIKYSLTSDNGILVKKGESNTYNLDIEYISTYSEHKTIDNNIEISLVGDNIDVPDTLITGFAIILYVVLLGAGLTIMVITNKKAKLLVLLLLVFVIPTTYALTKISVKMSNKIIINIVPKYDVIYHLSNSVEGNTTLMTEEEARNSGFMDYEKVVYDIVDEEEIYLKYYIGDFPTPYYEYTVKTYKESYRAGEVVTLKDLVLYSAVGCVYDDDYNATCDSLEKTYLIRDLTTSKQYYWYYEPEVDERDILQLTGDGDYYYQLWDSDYSIHVRPPKTFVMPNHSMNFEQENIAPV